MWPLGIRTATGRARFLQACAPRCFCATLRPLMVHRRRSSNEVALMRKSLAGGFAPWLIAPWALVAACAAHGAGVAREALPAPDTRGPQVMGWVPAYGIEQSLKALNDTPAAGRAL